MVTKPAAGAHSGAVELAEREPSAKIILRVEQAGQGRRIDAYLVDALAARGPTTTRAEIQRWIGEERVLLDGSLVRAKDRLRLGQRIEVHPGLPPLSAAQPEADVRFDVVFEDDELLVVDKPAGLVVHPARGHPSGTLVNGLLARSSFTVPAADPRDSDAHLRPGIVHRIDKDTSGLLVVAKTVTSRELLKLQLAEHRMAREYRAIVVGSCAAQTISTLHGRDPRSRLRFSCEVSEGKKAVTHVEPLARWGKEATLVQCRLETGRTHQIRVHLSQKARCPLLGDALYGGLQGSGTVAAVGRQLARQALHAATLGFEHPDGRWLEFRSPLPVDFERAMAQLDEALGRSP